MQRGRCLWTVLVALTPVLSGLEWSRSIRADQDRDGTQPEFRHTEIKEVESAVGQMVLLPCTVAHLGDRVVSWIRTRDLHILTSGPLTFSADNRFESVHSSNRDFWGLRIRGARAADAGQYECQVNTDPKMSFAVNLTVTDRSRPTFPKYLNRAAILGPADLFVREGAPLALACEISPLVAGPKFFFPTRAPVQWFHGDQGVKMEADGGRDISVDTDYTDRKVTSHLRVSMATAADAGTYTCKHASSQAASARVFVVEDESEHTEVMLKDFPPRPLMVARSGSGMKRGDVVFLYIVCVNLVL